MECITTDNCFDTGNKIEYMCPICLKKDKNTMVTWVGIKCSNCNYMLSLDEWRGEIARVQRNYLKLTRKQLGEKLGYSKNTIRQYEWVKCPDRYWNKLQELMKNQND